MTETFQCAVCQSPATNCCAKCRNVYYCSREHQKVDWSRHKANCATAYVITESKNEGRYLIAQRPIKQGEVILQELPLAIGPKLITIPLCLGCYKPISGNYRCSKCQWPMCSAACEESRFHKEAECRLIKTELVSGQLNAEQINPQIYQFVTPLRCLSLSPSEKKKINAMVSHVAERRNTEIYWLIERNIVGVLNRALRSVEYDTDSIHHVCGVLDTNSFDIRLPGRVPIRGLYPTASLLNHECIPNTRHVFDPASLRIKMFATREIKKGDKITATYSQSLWNTLNRRQHLMSVKHFWCECKRCADPEEFGTMLSALKCSHCSGFVLSREPLNHKSDWVCNRCGSVRSAQQVFTIHQSIRNQLKELGSKAREQPELLESFIANYPEHIHPSSCHVAEAKLALVQLYGNTSHLLYPNLTDYQLKNKEDYCRHLLQLGNSIEPGISQFRGLVQYELLLTLEEKLARKRLTQEQRMELIAEIGQFLKSSEEILTEEAHWAPIFSKCRDRLRTTLSLSCVPLPA